MVITTAFERVIASLFQEFPLKIPLQGICRSLIANGHSLSELRRSLRANQRINWVLNLMTGKIRIYSNKSIGLEFQWKVWKNGEKWTPSRDLTRQKIWVFRVIAENLLFTLRAWHRYCYGEKLFLPSMARSSVWSILSHAIVKSYWIVQVVLVCDTLYWATLFIPHNYRPKAGVRRIHYQ